MKLKLTWLMTLFMAFVMQLSFAQEKTVTGTVTTADDGLPLPGASVIVKGTTRGVQTDFDGNYSIKATVGETLVFSYVGMKDTESLVGASNSINVAMQADNALEEVVIQAYRTSTAAKSNIAVTTITSKTVEGRPNASFAQTLQGQVAGLNITTGNGQPGGDSVINLRGVSSLSGNTEPLFIIDGVPVDEDNFRSLNPNDIESLSVLKDAGATAIYGNRGANGVVLIKTRRGSYNSGLKINYTGTTSFSTLQNHDYDLMNSREQLQLEQDFGSGFGATLSDAELALRASQTNTDWLDVFFGTGLTQSHTLNLTSGGENINSFTSFGFTDQEGILKKASSLKRFNFRSNLNGKSSNGKFNYGTSFTFNYSESNEPNSIGSGAINRNFVLGANQSVPYISPASYVPGGGGNIPVVFANTPLFLLDRRDTYTRREDEIKIIANVNASYALTDNLTFRTSFGGDFTDEQLLRVESPISFNAQLFAATGDNTPGFSDQDSRRSVALNFNNSLTWSKVFAEKHSLEVSLFTEYFKAHRRSFGFRQQGFSLATFFPGDGAAFVNDNANDDNYVDTGRATIRNAGLFSYFGFADYDYDSKYGFSATLRRDASYRFAASNRWGTFWSVAGRWNISNEAFMEDSIFNQLKLRASYGTTGNQRIVAVGGQFAYFAAADLTQDFFNTGGQYGGANGLSAGQIGNNDLKWETIIQSNIGLDFALIDNRLRGSFDVYQRNTEDLFIQTPIAPSLNGGVTALAANVGELKNSGFDVELHYDVFKSKDEDGFNLSLNVVGNYNKQEIISLGEGGDQPFIRRVGGVIGEIYAAPYVGVNPANGNLLFLDIDGNLTEDIDTNDQRATGKNIFPDYQGSFGFEADYKNFFLTTQFNYTIGVDRFDFDLQGFLDPTAIGQFRHSRDILRAWSQPGDITDIPSLNATNASDEGLSDRLVRDSDYLRLRFIQFGYNVPKKILDKIGFSSLRAYVSGENLVTWSKWRGFDAEALGAAQNGYPTPKTYSIGIEFGF
ncbi:SusC/RagA family TonB-linked outer membrane protein [Flavobacteriales bacterium 33_180_T64]|nr:SusC/RagA family TonB-linked outer membrane protein [Flavobacteriales bacterium 33_180_T64]